MRLTRVSTSKLRRWAPRVLAVMAFVAVAVTCPSLASASGDPGLVPISWALDITSGKASNVAVAVPWSVDFAHWRELNEPSLLRFFPHVSLLGSGDAHTATLSNNPHLTLGCGVELAHSLAVGVGIPMGNQLSHAYIMAGLSLTDLLNLALSRGDGV